MAFTITTSELDLGLTPIENLFINDFMPMANGTHVKVYLMGYHFATQQQERASNETLAKHLNLSIEDVVQAWRFWESKGLVKCVDLDSSSSSHQFEVSFISVRQIYLDNNYSLTRGLVTPTPTSSIPDMNPTPSDRLFSAMSNPIIKSMFGDVQYLVRRPLLPQEHVRILNWMTDYKMDPDMIERAFHITYEERKIQDFHFNYVEGILTKWYDKRILTLSALDEYAATIDHRHLLYKQVYQAIGVNNRLVSAGDKELIDHWCDKDELTHDFILHVIKEATKRTTNPNLNYIAKVIANILGSGPATIETADGYFNQTVTKADSVQDSKAPRLKKSTFQNFKQSTIANMSDDEMKEILKRKSEKRKTSKGDH